MPLDEHQYDNEGEHDEEECEFCLECQRTIIGECRCGNCCEDLIIEASLRDAEREPKIVERGSPIYDDMSGERVLIGYLLNSKDSQYGCVFLDRDTRLCTIHPTRPLCCRLFDCAGYEHRGTEPAPSLGPNPEPPAR